MKRVHYFHGQLLSADDFQTEQEYHLSAHRRQNLRDYGAGIVSGLQISISGGEIVVSPGTAIDGYGHEIILNETQTLILPADRNTASIVISYRETLTDPVQVAGETAFSRVEEGFVLEIAPDAGAGKDSVMLASLRLIGGQWHVEPRRKFPLVALGVAALILTTLWRLSAQKCNPMPCTRS